MSGSSPFVGSDAIRNAGNPWTHWSCSVKVIKASVHHNKHIMRRIIEISFLDA